MGGKGANRRVSQALVAPTLFPAPATPAAVFTKIRNYLAGRHLGATSDSALLDQVLICLFAKLYLSKEPPTPANSQKAAYVAALDDLRRAIGPDILPKTALRLSEDSLEFVDKALGELDLSSSNADLVGDAYQCFRGADARGQDGQFFTPPAAIRLLVSLVDPQPGETVIDPACGTGGFLYAAARHLSAHGLAGSKVARQLFGIDKDGYLAQVARSRLSLLAFQRPAIAVGDSLAWRSQEDDSFMESGKPHHWDVVLTNPPFGTRIVAASAEVRAGFELAHRWVQSEDATRLVCSDDLLLNTPPQVLFVERCISLVRPGGRIGMVVPESILSGKTYRHVVQYICERAKIEAVIGMPEALFKTSGKGGTHTKTALLFLRRIETSSKDFVFMAEASWCGQDSRGRRIPKDDTDAVVANYRHACDAPMTLSPTVLGFVVPHRDLKPNTLAPRVYDPEARTALRQLEATHELTRIGDLINEGLLSLSTDDEVGKLAYGTGEIPFVRTSDLSNWEIKLDPKHGVNRGLYEALRLKQDVQPLDILMVRDGTYLIGTCAMVTKYDSELVYQSHIYKIRVHPSDLLDPYLLLAVMSSRAVQLQVRSLVQTQDIINSLGNRIVDVVLPIPIDPAVRRRISETVERIVTERAHAREMARAIVEEVAPISLNRRSG